MLIQHEREVLGVLVGDALERRTFREREENNSGAFILDLGEVLCDRDVGGLAFGALRGREEEGGVGDELGDGVDEGTNSYKESK